MTLKISITTKIRARRKRRLHLRVLRHRQLLDHAVHAAA
jgi:hypothetical protein